MSTNKFTPGPWEVYEAHGQLHIADAGGHIATPEYNKDAQLIAAAPELLEALHDFIKALDFGAIQMNSPKVGGGRDEPPHPWHDEWLHKVRAAIAKATQS